MARRARLFLGAVLTLASACGGKAVVDAESTGVGAAGGGGDPATGGSGAACDADADGFVATACDGNDCDDDDPTIHPGALDDPPGRWQLATLDADEDTGWSSAIAVDPKGVVHVSYVQLNTSMVRYGRRDGDLWTFETLAMSAYATGGFGMTGIAVHVAGLPHLCFVDPQGQLQHATPSTGSWQIEPVGIEAEHCAIAVGIDHSVHIAAVAVGSGLRYAVRVGGDWQVEGVDPSVVYVRPAIAVAADGTVHLAYPCVSPCGPAPGQGILRHAQREPSGWSIADISPAEGFTTIALALGADGEPHATYYSDPGALFHAVRRGDTWISDTVDSGSFTGVWSAVDIDAQGDVHVAYMSQTRLHYARRTGGRWQRQTLDDEPWIGAHVALAVEDSGVAHIAARGSDDQWSTNHLDYATNRAPANGVDDDCDGHEW